MKVTVNFAAVQAGRLAAEAKKAGMPLSAYVRMLAERNSEVARIEKIAIEQLRLSAKTAHAIQGGLAADEIKQKADAYISRFLESLA